MVLLVNGEGDNLLLRFNSARRQKRRDFRALWIVRINAAARLNGTTYSKLTAALKKAGVVVDRKILADLALSAPGDFAAVVKAASA